MNIYGQPFIQLKIHSVKNRIKNIVMLHWFALFTVLLIWFELWHVRRLKWWGFLVCSIFVFFSVMSTRPQKAIYQKINIRFGLPDFQNKWRISYHHGNYFFINNKTHCFYFNPLIPGGSKRWNSQTYGQKLLFVLSIYDLLLPRGMRVLKEELSRKKAFMNF